MLSGDDKQKMLCAVCCSSHFTLEAGFYYCDECGEQAMGQRETEIDFQDAPLVNIKRSQKKAERTTGQGKGLQRERSRKLRADPHMCERALAQDNDFPTYLDTIGTRLCTATKLVAKLASVLTDEPFRVPKRCVYFSRLILFSYFREAKIAFCDEETADDQTKTFCPLVKRTKPELTQLRKEREAQAKERRAQRRRERMEQSTVWEQLTRTFNAGDINDDDKSDAEADEATLQQQEPISLFRRVTTSLALRTVNMAGVIYLGIDLLLCIVFMAVQMAGARWLQLSDLFRWYREGRFTVSQSQLCALNFATGWELDNGRSNAEFCAKRLTRRFFVRSFYSSPYYGIQSSSESFRVLSFLTQFVGIPKCIQTAPFKDVLFRLVYNLNLPRAFERQLNALLAVLPPPLFTDYGAQRLGAAIPMIAKNELLERLVTDASTQAIHGHAGNRHIGFVSFLRRAFDQRGGECSRDKEKREMLKDRRRHVLWQWLPMSSEVNAAALVLFALKMFFGLDDDESFKRVDTADTAVLPADTAASFNFNHWLLQLQLRMHCWQGTTAQVVLSNDFSACQLERSNTEIPYRRPAMGKSNTGVFCLGGARLFHRHRKQPFAGCVPNMLHNRVQHRLFEHLFPNLHRLPVTPSALVAISNEELYAPLQYQCMLNRPLLDILKRRHRNEVEQELVEQLDKCNAKIFFRNFYTSTLPLCLSSRQRVFRDDEQITPMRQLFPCADKYSRISHPKIRASRMSAIVAQPLRRLKWIRAIFVASEYAMPTSFRLLLRHLALCVAEWEEVLYMAFLAVQGMFIDLSSNRRRQMMKQQDNKQLPNFSSSEDEQDANVSGAEAVRKPSADATQRQEEEEALMFTMSSSSSSGEDERDDSL